MQVSGVSGSQNALQSGQSLQSHRVAEQQRGEETQETSGEAQREIATRALRDSMDQQQQQAQALLQIQQTGRVDLYA